MNRFVRSRSYAAVAALAACVAALSACSSSGGKSAGSTSSPAGGGGSSSTATAGTTATKSAIVIGNVSAESGPEEASLGPQQNGLDAWVKYTNDNGGIQGHPIKLVTADSKSDPTVEATSFQTLAKSQHPVAFVGVGAFALASAVPFLSSSGIPVIGGNSDDAIWNQNGILYSQGTSHVAMLFGSAASAGSANKFGHVYCAESPACSQNDQLLFQIGLGKVAGTDPVFSQKVTLTQPDYTATCVAAKSAGATILQADLTTARTEVLAQNCQRQGYDVKFLAESFIASDELAGKIPDGSLTVQSDFPWFVNEGAAKTYHDAMTKYEGGKNVDAASVQGWVSGVIFGQAVENALKSGATDITSAEVRKGLAQIKDDTFGGLTPPITYGDGSKPNPQTYCWFTGQVSGGKWTSTDGLKAQCPNATQQAAIDSALTKLG